MKRFFNLILFVTASICLNQNIHAYDDCCSSFPIEGEILLAYDTFRGLPEGTWNGNNGGLIGGNIGMSIYDTFGIQAGGSYGIYDWYGRGSVGPGNYSDVQQQGFVTGGVFYKSPCASGIQGGLVVDWMFNRKFGVFAVDPSFGQGRLQVGYLYDGSDEFGFWGTLNINTVHKSVYQIPVAFRAISQANLFWRHYFENCAETMVWVGLPYRKGLMFSGKRAGAYILGASFRVPLTCCLNIEGHGMYMGPQNNHSTGRFQNDGVNLCIGINYSFGMGSNDCFDQWKARPYLSIANNSNFLVDTSLND